MEKKIIELGYKDENDNPQTAVVGEYVEKITAHFAQGEGDRCYYEVFFRNGDIITVFNPIKVLIR